MITPEACAALMACAFLAGGAVVVIVEALAGRPPRHVEAGDRGRN